MADDAETLEIALIENMQRKDLTPFEEADGLDLWLMTQFEYTSRRHGQKDWQVALPPVSEALTLRNIT